MLLSWLQCPIGSWQRGGIANSRQTGRRFAALPPLLQRVCGRVDVPDDDGAALAMFVMETGRKLYGVSDGSAKQGIGTH